MKFFESVERLAASRVSRSRAVRLPAWAATLAVALALALPACGAATLLDDAKASGKGMMALAYGSDWSRAGREVFRTYGSDAFRSSVGSRYVFGAIDLRESPTAESKAANKRCECADLSSFRLPALFVFGPDGRGFFAWENVPMATTAEEMSAKVAEAERIRDRAEALLAESRRLKGAEAAERIGEALSLLKPLLGTTERILGKKCYGAEFARLKELDPDDTTSWRRRFTMGSGVGLVTEVNAARMKGDIAKGEKIIARESAKSARHLTQNQRQAIAMLPFALHRENASRRDENVRLLDRIASEDADTLWGMAAVGFLRRLKAQEAEKYLKPKAEREILRPRGQSPGKPTFDYDATLSADLRALEDGESLVRAYILVSAGKAAIGRILSREGGDRFIGAMMSDRKWMEAFAGSGPWHYGAGSALELLDLMAWNEPGVFTNAFLRNAATAFSMNFSATNAVDETRTQERLSKGAGAARAMPVDAALVRSLRIFRELSDAGRLHDSFYGLDTYEMRYLLFPWDRNNPEDLLALNAFCNTTMDRMWKLGWKVPYRMRSCFGDSVHSPEYYQPWIHAQSRYITAPEIGGVCNMISSFATTLCHSHGMMAVTAGQPFHCAFVVRPKRCSPRSWETHYYIQPYTKGRWGVFKWGGYQNLLAAEALYTGTDLEARERPRWLATVRRAMQNAREAYSAEIGALYRSAMESARGNWPAGRDWCAYLEECDAPDGAWTNYVDTVLETVPDRIPILCELMKPYLDRLSAQKRTEELDAALLRMICAAKLPERKFSEHPNLSTLLDAADKQVGKNSEGRMFGIYSKALSSMQVCGEYFMQALAWGAKRYLGQSKAKMEDEYVHLVSTVLEGASAGAVAKGGGAKNMLRKLIKAAEDAAVRERRDRIVAMMDKLYPPPPFPAGAKPYPEEDFGAPIVSADAFVQHSGKSSQDKSERHHELCDTSPMRSRREGAPVYATGAKKDGAWVRLRLGGDTEVAGIVIVNARDAARRAKRLPMKVEVSPDGEKWTQVAEFRTPEDSWRVPLDGSVGRLRYVRAWIEGEDATTVLTLQKFLVYGRKLY